MSREDLWDIARDILTGIFDGEDPDYEIVDEVAGYVDDVENLSEEQAIELVQEIVHNMFN